MECLNEGLTKETVLERIDSYLHGELSLDDDKQFTDHILECEYCQETLLLYKMMSRVGKEYADEIFPKAEAPQQDERIPTLWLMLNNAPKEQIKCSPGIQWTTELFEPGLHSIINQEKQILFQIKKLPEAEKGVSVRGAPKDSFKIETKTIPIPLLGSTEKGELTFKVERRNGRYFLTVLFKIRDS